MEMPNTLMRSDTAGPDAARNSAGSIAAMAATPTIWVASCSRHTSRSRPDRTDSFQ